MTPASFTPHIDNKPQSPRWTADWCKSSLSWEYFQVKLFNTAKQFSSTWLQIRRCSFHKSDFASHNWHTFHWHRHINLVPRPSAVLRVRQQRVWVRDWCGGVSERCVSYVKQNLIYGMNSALSVVMSNWIVLQCWIVWLESIPNWVSSYTNQQSSAETVVCCRCEEWRKQES